MWGQKGRKIAHLQADLADTTERLGDAKRAADAARQTIAFEVRQRAEAEAGAQRVAARNERLNERLEAAREAQGDAEFDRLFKRLCRALRGCDRYRHQLATAQSAPVGLAAQLQRAHETIRQQAEKLADLQASNDAMCREAVDRAGTLEQQDAPEVRA